MCIQNMTCDQEHFTTKIFGFFFLKKKAKQKGNQDSIEKLWSSRVPKMSSQYKSNGLNYWKLQYSIQH